MKLKIYIALVALFSSSASFADCNVFRFSLNKELSLGASGCNIDLSTEPTSPIEPEPEPEPEPETAGVWIPFVQSHGQGMNLSDDSDWGTLSYRIDLLNKNFLDSDLPQVNIPTSKIDGFRIVDSTMTHINFFGDVREMSSIVISGASFTNINGLSGLQGAQGALTIVNSPNVTNLDALSNVTGFTDLRLYNNGLVNINGLSNIGSTRGNIFLENNNLSNVDGLSGVGGIEGDLHIYNNPNLTDISGLNNIALSTSGNNNTIEIRIDDPDQYTVKPDPSGNFCRDIRYGRGTLYHKDSSGTYQPYTICQYN